MGKTLNHRFARWLRWAAIGALLCHDAVAPWAVMPAYAQAPDTIAIGVTPVSKTPPAAVADLMASVNPMVPAQAVLTWTAPQGNAGGTPIPNQKVASYAVRYATFSVDSLSGDTTSWWNSPGTASTTLQPPGYNPKAPGNLEVYIWASLPPGTTLYFALKSTSLGSILSPIDTESSTPGQQAHALIPGTFSAPSSFSGTALSSSSIRWSWSLVPGATGYLIYSDPANSLLQTLSDPTSSWIETNLTANTAYSRKASATNGTQTSGYSSVGTRYTFAAVPGTPSVTGVTGTTVLLSWNASSNPAGTTYGVERSPDGSVFSQVSQNTSATFQDAGLTSNTTYYYRVRAQNGDSIWTAYTAVVSALTTPAGAAPLRPNGLSASSSAGQFTLLWHPVTLDTNRQPISIQRYDVYRYEAIGSTPTLAGTEAPNDLSFGDTVGGLTYFYRIFAVSVGGVTSSPSDYVDSSAQLNRYAIASDDQQTRVVMPASISRELNSEVNVYGQDLEVRLTRRQQDEVDVTLRSYHVGANKALTGEEIPGFAFSQAGMQVQLGLGAILGAGRPNSPPPQQLQRINPDNAGSIAQIVSVYWYNGGSYIRISDPVLTSNQAISVNVRSVGTYQIRATQISTVFKLTQGSPYPRVITPNDPSQNNRVFWFFDNPAGETVTGTIYDIRGAKVRDLAVNGQSPTSNSIVWDGRDMNGAVVPSGVYLYKITAGKDKQTGTVVVAR